MRTSSAAGGGIVTAAGAARPAKPLPIVFGYIVAALFFRLMIDLAHSSRSTYEIL